MTRTEVTNSLLKQLIDDEAESRTALQATIRSLSLAIHTGHHKLWREIYSVHPELRGKENFIERDGGKMFVVALDEMVVVNGDGGSESSAWASGTIPTTPAGSPITEIAPLQSIQVG